MNLFEYVTKMEEIRSPLAYVGVAFLALVILYIAFKMLFGMLRGTWRQLISTGCTLLAAIIAYFSSTNLATKIVDGLGAENIGKLVPYLENYIPDAGKYVDGFFDSFGDEFISRLFAIPSALILAPIMMATLFVVLHLLFKLVKAIVVAVVKVKKADGSPSRLGGVLLAIVEAVIVITMLIVPLSGVLGIVDDVYTGAIELTDEEDVGEMSGVYERIISPMTKNPIVRLGNSLGSERMYKNLSVVKIGEEKINISEEVVGVSHMFVADVPTLFETNYLSLNENDKEAIDNITAALCESEYLTNIIVNLLNGAAVAIENGDINLNIGGAYESLFDSLVDFLASATRESLVTDINTVKEIYYTISDSGILEAVLNGADVMELLQERRQQGDDTVKKIVEILKKNERTSSMITSMTEALISTLSNNIQLGDDVTITYDELKGEMNNLLSVKKEDYETDSEYMEALSGTLDDTLRNHGIELEKEIVDSIAEYVDKEYAGKEEFTDEEFNDVLLHYYDAYLDYMENGEIPDDIIGGGDNTGDTAPIGNKVGNTCHAYPLDLVDGSGKVSVDNYRGSIVIINFWGVWCDPCKSELPHFNRIAEEYDGEVVVLTIHTTTDKESAPSYIANNFSDSKMIFAYDIGLMPNVDMYYNLLGGGGSYPRTMILDESGVITFIQDGSLGYDDLVREIESIQNK